MESFRARGRSDQRPRVGAVSEELVQEEAARLGGWGGLDSRSRWLSGQGL